MMKRLILLTALLLPVYAHGEIVDHDFNDLSWGGFTHGSKVSIDATGGVGGGAAAKVYYDTGGTLGKNLDFNVAAYATDEYWIEFDVRGSGSIDGGCKFLKLFGYDNTDGGQYNNMTLKLAYEGSHNLKEVGYYIDSIRIAEFDGDCSDTNPPTYVVATDNNANVTDGSWHHVKYWIQRADQNTRNGAIKVWVDGTLKVHLTGMESNPGYFSTYFEFIRFGGYNNRTRDPDKFDWGYWVDGQSVPWSLYYDNIYIGLTEKDSNVTPINGSCGTATEQAYTEIPTTNLCATGTASTVASDGDSVDWTCSGIYGGTPATCTASYTPPLTDGVCGSSDGSTFSSPPTSDLCIAGTTGTVSLSDTIYSWACSGLNGGVTDNCTATYAEPSTENGIFSFSSDTYSTDWDAGYAYITINRTVSNGAATVTWGTLSDTAKTNVDYYGNVWTTSFTDGESSKQLSIQLYDNPTPTYISFNLIMSESSTGSAVGTPNTGTVTIIGTESVPNGQGNGFFVGGTILVNGSGETYITGD